MRILMAVPKFPYPVIGGLERQSHSLSVALVEHGHTVHALSGRFDRSQKTNESIDGVRVHRLPWPENKPARFLLFPVHVARLMFRLRKQVDLVHVHNISWFGAFVSLFARWLGLPVITKLPNFGEFGIPAIRQRASGPLLIRLLKRCDAIIALTPESVKELTEIDYPSRHILRTTNGIAVAPGPPQRPVTVSNRVNVIFVGRLSWEKGISDLLHAWEVVNKHASRPVRLQLLGDGPLMRELRTLASQLELGDSVEFSGFCDDVPAELGKADLFVLPSYAEGNSNSILEAMRAGLPIVATRVGGTSIQVGKEGCRFLIQPGDRHALAEKLLELIGDGELRARTGASMLRRIESVFDISLVAAIYEQAYELIMQGHHDKIGDLNPHLFTTGAEATNECAE